MKAIEQEKDTVSLRARVFSSLENAIINGEYKEGDTLNEIKISGILGVSRTPVRESLMQLELEGLVENIPNKGAIVIGLAKKDIRDIYEIRLRIESFATELAVDNISNEELDALEKIVELQEYYAGKGNTSQIHQLDSDFHNIIYEASGNRFLANQLTSLHKQIKRARGLSLDANNRSPVAVTEHRSMLDAIKAGNKELAKELTTMHVRNAYDNLIAELSEKPLY